jgi:hypothetical protein
MSTTAKLIEAPPATATDAEIIDWYLHKVRLSGPPGPLSPLPRDPRGIALKCSLIEILTKMAQIIPSAEDVKNPFDFWSFMEPVFSPGLRASMIPETGILPLPPPVEEAKEICSQSFPHYTWSWALEDCVNLSAMTAEEIEELKNALPVVPDKDAQVNQELERTLLAVDESTKLASASLIKLHKQLRQFEKNGDFSKLKNASLSALLSSSEILIVQLQRDQLLDSVEEVHRIDDQSVGVVIDDAERVRCYTTTVEDIVAILEERDSTLEGPQAESIQYKYPFAARSRFPQIGPFCHICRQAKPQMAKCTNKLSQFYGEAKEFKSVCHRRYCIDCLVAYNWPKPDPAVSTYKCPICAKLCTCDRCVRNVFLKSIRQFICGLKCESSTSANEAPKLSEQATYVTGVKDFFNIIGDISAFVVAPATPSLESPTTEVPPSFPGLGRAKRQSGIKQQNSLDEVEVDTVVKKGRATSSLLKSKKENGKKGGVKSETASPASDDLEMDNNMSDDEKGSNWSSATPNNGDTPPSDRKRRKAASIADHLLRKPRR